MKVFFITLVPDKMCLEIKAWDIISFKKIFNPLFDKRGYILPVSSHVH